MADKPYITIAVEPCGEFCNEADHSKEPDKQCPFLLSYRYMLGVHHDCKIFGPLCNQSFIKQPQPVPRHEGCIEAQRRFEDDERRKAK